MATKSQTTILTPYQVNRYSRHIIMPQVGSVGQRKLLDAKVLMVGAGGLGSPISIYLTLAGVGTIGLVEFDNVDVTNLQSTGKFPTRRDFIESIDENDFERRDAIIELMVVSNSKELWTTFNEYIKNNEDRD